MAQRLDQEIIHHHAMIYPWDEWMDGSLWLAIRGVDFDVKPTSFRVQIHHEAQRRGGVATTRILEDQVQFRFFPEGEAAARLRVSHASCNHPMTKTGRRNCPRRVQRDQSTPHHPDLRED